MKFLRRREIIIQNPQGEQIRVDQNDNGVALSVKFKITRNTLAPVNKCQLEIVNLSEKTRRKIYKDRYTINQYWQMQIKAGYKKLETVFQGNINESLSEKNNTEWITKIDAFDGLFGVQNGFVSESVTAGSNKASAIGRIIPTMPNMLQGILGSRWRAGTEPRGRILLGKSSDVLNTETDGKYFIDNEVVNAIGDDEYLPGQVIVINSDQLLGSPRRRETLIDCRLLFFPSMRAGQLCELRSQEKIYNGQYKVVGFEHNVNISSAEAGTAETTASLYSGAGALRSASDAN